MNAIRANPSPFRAVLAVQPFRTLWAAQVCSQLGFAMLLFVLALRVYQLTASNAAVSALFLTFGVPAVLFGMAAGAIVDHIEKRVVLVIADFSRAILALGFFLFPGILPVLYVVSFVTAGITQFYVPAEVPMIPKLVPEKLLVTANSLFSFTYYSSLGVGSIVAGPILRVFGPYGVFLVVSALFMIAGAIAWHLPKEKARPGNLLARHVTASVREGLAYVKATPTIVESLLLLTGTQVVVAILATLGPGFADRVLEIDIHDASVLITGPVVLGIILGALWVGNVGYRIPARRLIKTGIIAAGAILILISLTVRLKRVALFAWFYADPIILPIELILFFLLGIANSMLDVPATAMLQSQAGGSMRGRVYGILTTAVGGVGMLPIVLTGLVADFFGAGKVIFLLGCTLTLYGFFRIRYNKNIS